MEPDDTQVAALIDAVRATARAEILPHFRNLDADAIDTKSAADDLVTVADRAAEVAITAAARDILPGAAVVGEEAVSAERSILDQIGTAQTCVIIDPIDGTWNYANGVGTFGVILAVVSEGQTVMGLLYDPLGDDWIVARRGAGAWFARPGQAPRRLRIADQPPDLAQSFGFVGLYLYPPDLRPQIAAQLPAFRRSYSLRCSCHEYRLMTEGRAAFNLGAMLNPWDHAAGVLCLEEAGGVARLINGTPYAPTMTQGRLLAATSQTIWDQMAARFHFLS